MTAAADREAFERHYAQHNYDSLQKRYVASECYLAGLAHARQEADDPLDVLEELESAKDALPEGYRVDAEHDLAARVRELAALYGRHADALRKIGVLEAENDYLKERIRTVSAPLTATERDTFEQPMPLRWNGPLDDQGLPYIATESMDCPFPPEPGYDEPPAPLTAAERAVVEAAMNFYASYKTIHGMIETRLRDACAALAAEREPKPVDAVREARDLLAKTTPYREVPGDRERITRAMELLDRALSQREGGGA